MSAKSGIWSNPWMPPAVVATPRRAARSRPSEVGSMPTSAAGSSTADRRAILINRSVPMLPEPRMAILVFFIQDLPCEGRGHLAQSFDMSLQDVAGLDRHHRAERAGQDDLSGRQGPAGS